MVAGACLTTLAGALAWQAGAQARDGASVANPSGPGPATARAAAPPASTSLVEVLLPVPSTTTTPAGAGHGLASAAASPEEPASGVVDDAPVDKYLLLRTVPLGAGRRGEAYRPLLLVGQAARADAVRLTGRLPPGLMLGDDGNLRGVPTREGLFQFQLEVVERTSSQTLARQRYALRVLTPARAPALAASSPAAAVKPWLKTLSEDDSAAYVDVDKAVPASYLLTSIAAWVPTEEAARSGSDAASAVVVSPSEGDAAVDANVPVTAVEAARLPTIDQLRAMLTPLVGIEYPTRPLFVQALSRSRCDYYLSHLEHLDKEKNFDLACPPASPASGSASKSPGDPMSLPQFYRALLPPRIEKEVIDAALKLHPIADSKPLVLSGDGCGCNIPKKDENVYGMFPYWLATKEVQAVDFSLFSHIGFMGAVLQDDGSLAMPSGSIGRPDSFARVAAQHATSVDLVVYRRDWATLLRRKPKELEVFVHKAAEDAVQKTELRFDDATAHWLQPLLIPGWRVDGRVYAGLTIFFDDTSVEPGQRTAFKQFYKQFTDELILAMQRHDRSYHLNFVVPDEQLGEEEGAYGFTQLAEYMELAQREPRDVNADEATKARYAGTTDISVFYLVTLSSPTKESRLELRARADRTTALKGHRLVAFLQGIVPMVFGARMADGQAMSQSRADDINIDLAYMRWNYGGAGFWPAPVVQRGQADPLHEMLLGNYHPPASVSGRVCELACPNRLLLRLLLQIALLVDFTALILHAWSCRLRRAGGRKLLLLIWLGGLAAIALGSVLLTCDPLLDSLRTSNWLFVGMFLLAGLWGAYNTFWPRMDPP